LHKTIYKKEFYFKNADNKTEISIVDSYHRLKNIKNLGFKQFSGTIYSFLNNAEKLKATDFFDDNLDNLISRMNDYFEGDFYFDILDD
jgi:hypothetical protein